MSKTKKKLSHTAMIAADKIRHKSKTKGAVKQAWEIFSLNRTKPRKECIDLALEAGIAFFTARTQYQAWRKAGEADKAGRAKSDALMVRLGLKVA